MVVVLQCLTEPPVVVVGWSCNLPVTSRPRRLVLDRKRGGYPYYSERASQSLEDDSNEEDDTEEEQSFDMADTEKCADTNETKSEDEKSLGEPGVVMDDLVWRVEKLRLEEQNTQRFLKAPARFLPYEECRKWVQAFGRWETETDWREWIAMGEKRNSYIPVNGVTA